jgi:hypothetical protein
MELARFFAFVFKLAIALALIGELKTCTIEMLGLAAAKSESGIMSYSKWNHQLWSK